MIILERWEPTTARDFPSQIPFTIKVQGIPLHLWSDETLKSIADDIGVLESSEIISTEAKMQVTINGLQPLITTTSVEFATGEEAEAFLVYEKLEKHCISCFSLNDDVKDCTNLDNSPEKDTAVNLETSRTIRSSNPHREHILEQSYRPTAPQFSHRPYQKSTENAFKNYPRERNSSDAYYSSQVTKTRHDRQGSSRARRYQTPPQWIEKPRVSETRREEESTFSAGSSRQRRPPLDREPSPTVPNAELPREALNTAMGEIRDVLVQYSSCADPSESAARKERHRLAEENGDIQEQAAQMVRAALAAKALAASFEEAERVARLSPSHSPTGRPIDRIPTSQRLGPPVEPPETCQQLLSSPVTAKKRGRPAGKKTNVKGPLLQGSGSQKRKVAQVMQSPRKRQNSASPRASGRGTTRTSGPRTSNTSRQAGTGSRLGNPWTVRRLKEIRKRVDPDIIFLSETKNPDPFVMTKVESLGYHNIAFVSPSSVASGGLSLLWKQEIPLDIISSCTNYFDTQITYEGLVFYSTFVYGDPERATRKQVWDQLIGLAQVRDDPWFLSGDFNDIINNSEKEGGPIRDEGTFSDFRTFLSEGDLYDLRHSGCCLSWRGRRNNHLVKTRLDRALSNNEWAELFPSGRCEYLRFEGSDHRPIVSYFGPTRKKRKSSFRAIVQWSKDQQVNSQNQIELLKQGIEAKMISPSPNELLLASLTAELNKAYNAEESFWKQRSSQLWLNRGDRNTSFFHASARKRFAINKFSVIEDEEGIVHFKEDQIVKVITEYFRSLFYSHAQMSEQKRAIITEALQPLISDSTNQELIKDPSHSEIKEALFAIHAEKAPGPDGFSASFFHSNWEVVGPDIIAEVETFFRSGELPRSSNDTHIRLIPKILGPRKVSDYRPIALCNVCYKVISKLLSRRLQPLLDGLISENQSAFVPKRAISDNVLITHEVLHFLKVSKAKVSCSMAVKTDMISYSFLINGAPRGSIKPSRGIRQGDPLSPYIFIICSEVLSGLCRKAQILGKLQGI
ncbi:unnamed protein product [Microthlaspi erraticum]|uniref:Reverse transcriptase domain-containing protein n=1 Tax=Microthlaspi erraticum TaxID=1685480 RepID=A0A6D2L8V2_9BRAS|nr:unnamed protein product [Microthlaspi erraticum]